MAIFHKIQKNICAYSLRLFGISHLPAEQFFAVDHELCVVNFFATRCCGTPKNGVDFLQKLHAAAVVSGKKLCYNDRY